METIRGRYFIDKADPKYPNEYSTMLIVHKDGDAFIIDDFCMDQDAAKFNEKVVEMKLKYNIK